MVYSSNNSDFKIAFLPGLYHNATQFKAAVLLMNRLIVIQYFRFIIRFTDCNFCCEGNASLCIPLYMQDV